VRYELPPGISPDEERAILAAMEQYFGKAKNRPSPWALAGRAEAIGLGALQIRYQSNWPWRETRLAPFTRRGSEPRTGRGDAK
jgi:hypothetical protein